MKRGLGLRLALVVLLLGLGLGLRLAGGGAGPGVLDLFAYAHVEVQGFQGAGRAQLVWSEDTPLEIREAVDGQPVLLWPQEGLSNLDEVQVEIGYASTPALQAYDRIISQTTWTVEGLPDPSEEGQDAAVVNEQGMECLEVEGILVPLEWELDAAGIQAYVQAVQQAREAEPLEEASLSLNGEDSLWMEGQGAWKGPSGLAGTFQSYYHAYHYAARYSNRFQILAQQGEEGLVYALLLE